MMTTTNPRARNYRWLCPLYSFDCKPESVDLGEGIEIKQITPEFKEYLEKRCDDWSLGDITDIQYMIIFPYRMEVNDETKSIFGNWHVSNVSFSLITALRLCHTGMVAPGPLVLTQYHNSRFSTEFNDIQPGMEVGPIVTPLTKLGFEGAILPKDKYKLNESDVPQIKELAQNLTILRGKKEPDNLCIALSRFNSSYHGGFEERIADRLIDHMIAFEFLYLGYDQELAYKLALRAAFLLEKDEGEKKDIYNKMKKAYKLRNDTVHGNKPVKQSQLEEIIPKTEEYLRRSIRRFLTLLSQGHSLKEIREKLLDENILSNGSFLALKE